MRHLGGRLGLAVLACSLASCAATQSQRLKSNALEYLYPTGVEATQPRDVTLALPVRVGLAFAPSGGAAPETFGAAEKLRLLGRIAEAFEGQGDLFTIEVLPANYLTRGGGFAELDRLAAAFGLDLVTLVSYDQLQFSETTRGSWTYLTVVGIFAVKGEKNETRTLLDAVVYDVPSRALLTRAAGESSIKGKSTPIDVGKSLRESSEEGFRLATENLIAELDAALEAFRVQIKTGTVRGPGTPRIDVVAQAAEQSGGGLGGAVGLPGLTLALLVAGWAGVRARRG